MNKILKALHGCDCKFNVIADVFCVGLIEVIA